MIKYLRSYESVINWLHDKLSPRQFLIFSSTLVGLTAGLAAVILKMFVHYIHLAITHDYHVRFQYYLYLIFPVIGILLTVWFVQKHLGGKLGRGTANILYAIAKKSSFLPKDQMYSHVVSSGLTVGFGGSAGLESPMVTTGAAIGSNYARTYHVSYKERTLLLASGSAAGIAAAFDSPIAGVLFALEVLLVDVSITAFIPLIIAAAAGALISKVVLGSISSEVAGGKGVLLFFKSVQPFDYHNVPLYIILGVLAGIVSVYHARMFMRIESYLKPKKKKVYLKAVLGGAGLSLLILFFPQLFGEGYDGIKILAGTNPQKFLQNSILAGWAGDKRLLVLLVVLTMLTKTIATALTLGSGGNGGNFAPSLFIGACLGFSYAALINITGMYEAPIGNFTVVAMAGILSGVFHAPLTGIFLIAEITGGYELMIPLMIVSATSFAVAKYFEPHSMDTKRLARKGHIFTSDKDRNILFSLKTSKLVETGFQTVPPDASLRELVEVVAHSNRNIFPVVTKDGKLLGVILLDTIREIMFKQEMYDEVTVRQLMRKPRAVIAPDEDMTSVMKKFDETETWNLPVVDDGKYIGFISKSSIFTRYRENLMKSGFG